MEKRFWVKVWCVVEGKDDAETVTDLLIEQFVELRQLNFIAEEVGSIHSFGLVIKVVFLFVS